MNDLTNVIINGQRCYYEEEMYRRIKKAFDAGYRRAIEVVKEQSGYGDVDLDRFLEELVEKMMKDWHTG